MQVNVCATEANDWVVKFTGGLESTGRKSDMAFGGRQQWGLDKGNERRKNQVKR